MKVQLYFKLLLIIFVIFSAGILITHWFVDSSPAHHPEGFTDSEMEHAREEMMALLFTCLDNPLNRLFIVKSSLVELTAVPYPDAENAEPPLPGTSRAALATKEGDGYIYEGKFRNYTYFAIPVGSVEISQEGVLCSRKPTLSSD